MTDSHDDGYALRDRLICDACGRELTSSEMATVIEAPDGTITTFWLCDRDKGGCGWTGWC